MATTSCLSYRKDPWIIVARVDWVRWVQQQLRKQQPQSTTVPTASSTAATSFLQEGRLSSDDCKWLLEVLVAQNHARILQRPQQAQHNKPDLVLLRSDGTKMILTTESAGKHDDDDDDDDNSLQVPLSLYDLQQSTRAMEAQLDDWAHQVQVCSQKALRYKQLGQRKLALVQLSKRKLVQQQIDTCSNTLIQLEQVHAAIEMAQSNQAVVQLLSQGSTLMHQLSAETSVEEIDELHDDVQEALDQIHETHQALVIVSSTTTSGMTTMTDDELLAELASLTIQDDDEPTTNESSSPTTTAASKEKKTVPQETPALTPTESNDGDCAASAIGAS
jgi:hypothetical protein